MKNISFWKEAWSSISVLVFILAGWAVSVHDFVYLHQKVFQTPALVGGLLLMPIRLAKLGSVDIRRSSKIKSSFYDSAPATVGEFTLHVGAGV